MHVGQTDLFGASGPNAGTVAGGRKPGGDFSIFAQAEGAAPAASCTEFLESLAIPEGPNAGKPVKLAPFQRSFVAGALAEGTAAAVLSIGRGNAKSALAAGIALGGLVGAWDRQPRREIIVAARTRDQGRIAWDFAAKDVVQHV